MTMVSIRRRPSQSLVGWSVLLLLLLYASIIDARVAVTSNNNQNDDDHEGVEEESSSSRQRRGRRHHNFNLSASSSSSEGNIIDTTSMPMSLLFEWKWRWWYPSADKRANVTTTQSLGTLWEDLEMKFRSRTDEVEHFLHYVQQRLEATEFSRMEGLYLELELKARNMEAGLWDAIGGGRIQQELEILKQQAQQVERDMGTQLELVKRKIRCKVLRQREGWNRWSRSIRNFIGLVVGSVCTFAGGLSTISRRQAVALQAGQFTWMTTNHFFGDFARASRKNDNARKFRDQQPSRGRGPVTVNKHSWIQDTTFLAVATLILRDAVPLTPQLERVMPLFTVGYAVFRSTLRIFHILDEREKVEAYSPLQGTIAATLSAVLGMALVTVLPIPISVMAASLAGTKLVIDSVIDEVVGNWFHMMERIGPERLQLPRRLYRAVLRKFQREFLYPVREAFAELEGILLSKDESTNDKGNEMSLRSKVKEAVSRCPRLRLVWTIASLGILVQMELLHHGIIVRFLTKGYAALLKLRYRDK